MTLTPGTRLGPYEIVAPLGAGGMGEVYRARDSRLGREVAIKVLPAEVAADPERLRRFELEARAASALSHPNILTVHDFGVQDTKAYLVTELLDGSSLRERFARDESVPIRQALDWASQIAHGLAAAHAKGIVHRDLKPENLFVTRDGRVKILDFGLAKLTHPEGGSPLAEATTLAGLTETGTVMGTIGYMAPEQVRGERIDARADIFSFGCVLYELLTGTRAFGRRTPADTLSAILRDEPPAIGPTSAIPVSPALARLIAHCLEKDPARRFHSAEDLAWGLETAHQESGPAAVSASRRVPRRSVWLRIVATAIIAASLGALAVRQLAAPSPRHPGLERLTFERGRISGARFAPDGKEVVLTASWGSEAPRLFLKRAGTVAPLPLDTRDAKLLAVSRTGELALLLRPRSSSPFGQSGTLARQSLGGGAPREVVDSVGAADWHPQASELAIVIDEGDAERIEYPPGTVLYRTGGWIDRLRFSPDGKLLGFLEHPLRASLLGSVMVLDLAAGSTRQLVARPGNVDLLGLAWDPAGRELWFGDDLGRLLAIDLGGRLRVVAEYPLAVAVHDFGADGRLLLGQEDRRMGLLVEDGASGRARELSWLRWSVVFDIDRAGERVLFTEFTDRWTATGRTALRGTDGGAVVELSDGMAFDLSPDERTAVVVTQTEPFRLLLVPTGSGAVRELERGPIVAYDIARITPDGRRIVFVGRTAKSGARLFAQELAGGGPRQLSDEPIGFGQLAISPDGTEIATNGVDGAARILPIAGGTSRVVVSDLNPGAMLSWSADGRALLVRELGGVDIAIQRVDIGTGERTRRRELHPPDPIGIEFVGPVVTTPDERVWAYTYLRTLSTLYTATGLPEH